MEKKTKSLLLLAVLSQTMIDHIEDDMGLFTPDIKELAEELKDKLLLVMDKDFGSPEATHQLVELSQWIVDMFDINIKVCNLSESKQSDFQQRFSYLLNKFNVEK